MHCMYNSKLNNKYITEGDSSSRVGTSYTRVALLQDLRLEHLGLIPDLSAFNPNLICDSSKDLN